MDDLDKMLYVAKINISIYTRTFSELNKLMKTI